MLHTETVDADTLELLKKLQRNESLTDTRLVGGTALALHIGHRKSIDLDFFGILDMEPMEYRQELEAVGEVSLRSESRRIQRYMVSGVQVDLVDYPYPWLDKPVMEDGLRLATCRDIAAMKLSAITNRGTKKDFIDLAFLLDQFSLDEMLCFYTEKFSEGDTFLVLKSLVFFDDADDDPMPQMRVDFDWVATKQRIRTIVSEIGGA